MITPPERSPERDAAILALLPLVSTRGWTVFALQEAAGPDADLLFPGGTADLIEAHSDLADRWMEEGVGDLSGLRLPARVRALIVKRLEQNRPYKDAVRRALGILSLPGHALLAARCSGRTVDAIWHAAGDTAADFSWYTKRATLAWVYGTTLLYWLRDDSWDDEDTLRFLDRRLADVGRVGRVRQGLRSLFPQGRGSYA